MFSRFSNVPLFENHPQFHLTDRCFAPQSFLKSELPQAAISFIFSAIIAFLS
jgi:hypothetical protein